MMSALSAFSLSRLMAILLLGRFRTTLIRQSGLFVAAGGFSLRKPTFTVRGGGASLDSVHDSLSHSLSTLGSSSKSVRLLQVQIVHRHGDRTPITPLKNETFWSSTLPAPALLDKLDKQTRVIRDPAKPNLHKAGGRGPFGKLTQLGLLQMVELGAKLKEELEWEGHEHYTDAQGNLLMHYGRLFSPRNPLHHSQIQVVSTDFPRTIQSVQGVLVGLFPDESTTLVDIDARHTSNLIPDPQPRRTTEQEELELKLAARPHLQQREAEMHHLAVRTTQALLPLLGEGAFDVSFGVGEEKKHHTPHLAWTQLSEITKCLLVRDMLPPTISMEDQETISSYAAWKWMENLRHARLAYLAMHPMVSRMVESMKTCTQTPPLTIYSAHDSTLIGLLCAFRLETPQKWPEYGDYLKVELLECGTVDSGGTMTDIQYYVRFSLSGKVLKSHWHGEPVEIIPLVELEKNIATIGATSHHHSKEHSGV